MSLPSLSLVTGIASGKVVLQDYILAHMWMNLSASNSTGVLRNNVDKRRDKLAKKMPPEAIIEAQRLAREWKSNSSQPNSSHNGRDFLVGLGLSVGIF